VANRVPVHASGPFHVENYRARSLAVHTHCPPSGAFRGFGVPQSAVAQECVFDELADMAGIDRLEFRLINALDDGLPTATGQVFASGVGIKACLEALRGPYAEARKRAARIQRRRTPASGKAWGWAPAGTAAATPHCPTRRP
jgi:aldehyde oxidoreductase